MRVRDNSNGLLLMTRMAISNFVEDFGVCFVKSEPDNRFNLPGVRIRPRSTGDDAVVLFVFGPEMDLKVISNDAYCARRMLVKTIFGGKYTFNGLVDQLTITEEWTDSGKFFQPFFDAFMGWPTHPTEEPDAKFYPVK